MVKVRQFMDYFVKNISGAYEVFIYTQSLRSYARKICKLIDPEGILKLADSRILSRSEDDNPVKTLSKVIPHGFQQIIILDDRKDVWPGLSNLVFTVPFRYFIKNDQSNKLEYAIPHKEDSFLYFITHLLLKVRYLFYQQYETNKNVKVTDILSEI